MRRSRSCEHPVNEHDQTSVYTMDTIPVCVVSSAIDHIEVPTTPRPRKFLKMVCLDRRWVCPCWSVAVHAKYLPSFQTFSTYGEDIPKRQPSPEYLCSLAPSWCAASGAKRTSRSVDRGLMVHPELKDCRLMSAGIASTHHDHSICLRWSVPCRLEQEQQPLLMAALHVPLQSLDRRQ